MSSFFRHVRPTFLFICSTTSNLNNIKPQQLQPQNRVQNEKKKQNRRPQLRKHTKDPTSAPLFFGTMRHFEVFWIAPECPAFICFDILQHNGCHKNPKGPHFYIFRHCDIVQKFRFLILKSPKGPLEFFHVLQQTGVSKSPKAPFYNFKNFALFEP